MGSSWWGQESCEREKADWRGKERSRGSLRAGAASLQAFCGEEGALS